MTQPPRHRANPPNSTQDSSFNRPKLFLDCGLAANSPRFCGLDETSERGIIPTEIGLVTSTCNALGSLVEDSQELIAYQQFGEITHDG